MACSCQNKSGAKASPKSYTVTTRTGETKSYRSEVEAAAAARRAGGTYKAA